MQQGQIILKKCASGQIRARVRLCEQAPPPRAAVGGALSKHQNLQINEKTGEVHQAPPVLRLEAKRLIREYSSAIERAYGRERCIFLTGTLPGSSIEAMTELAKCQKTIQRRLRQWLQDVAACSVAAVIVWEYQKRGALHLHILVGHQDGSVVRKIRRGFKRYWVRLLQRLSAASGVDLFGKSDGSSHRMTPHVVRAWAQPVRKSVSAYLAKYLSKSCVVSGPPGVTSISRLWGATSVARQLLHSFTETALTVALPIEECLKHWEKLVSLPSVAAVPTFGWNRRYSNTEKAMAVCASFSNQERVWQDCMQSLDCAFLALDDIIRSLTTVQAPPLPYLAGVAAFFGGRAIDTGD